MDHRAGYLRGSVASAVQGDWVDAVDSVDSFNGVDTVDLGVLGNGANAVDSVESLSHEDHADRSHSAGRALADRGRLVGQDSMAAMWRTVVRKTQMLQRCLQEDTREVRLNKASDPLRPILNRNLILELKLILILIVNFLFRQDFIAINDGDKPHHMTLAQEKEKVW
jgi:hypothetical protein